MGWNIISIFSQIWTKIWNIVHDFYGQEPLTTESSPSAIASQISNDDQSKSMESDSESQEKERIYALNRLQVHIAQAWVGHFLVYMIIGTACSVYSSGVWWFFDIIAVCILWSECYMDVNFLEKIAQFRTKVWEFIHNWYDQQLAMESSSSFLSVSLSQISNNVQSPPLVAHMEFHSESDKKVEGDSSYGWIRSVIQGVEDFTDKVNGESINAVNKLQGAEDLTDKVENFIDKVNGEIINAVNRLQEVEDFTDKVENSTDKVENSTDKAEGDSVYELNRVQGLESSYVKVEGNSIYPLNRNQGVEKSSDKVEGDSIIALKIIQAVEDSTDKVERDSIYSPKRLQGVNESTDKVEWDSMHTLKRLETVEDFTDKAKGGINCVLNRLQGVDDTTDKAERDIICALNQEASQKAETTLFSVSFNQDFSSIVCGTNQGVNVYNSEAFGTDFSRDFGNGGISIVEKVYEENILVFVGSEGNTQYPPNKVIIWDDSEQQCIHEITFESQVQAVKVRWDYLVAVLENEIYVYRYSHQEVGLFHKIETLFNPKGLCVMSDQSTSPVLACPGLNKGQVHVEHFGQNDTMFIFAHNSDISCLALARSGDLLATASTKGTTIRIFSTLDGTCLQKLRRGVKRAEIYSIALSPTDKWLAVSSGKGTVHIFGLDLNVQVADKDSSNENVKTNSSLSFKKSILHKYLIPERSFAQFYYSEKQTSVIAFGQHNTIMIVGLDGSFYRCEFDPENGGAMMQKEHLNFLDYDQKIPKNI